jgi:hypothetical protein
MNFANALAVGVLESLPNDTPGEAVVPGVDAMKLSVYTKMALRAPRGRGCVLLSRKHNATSWLVVQGVDLYALCSDTERRE